MRAIDAIQHAAQYLPVDWELVIAIEAGYASLEIFDDQGERRKLFDFERFAPASERICDLVDESRRLAGVLGDVTCRLCKKTTATQSVAYYTSYCDCEKGVGAGCIHPICNECYQGLE